MFKMLGVCIKTNVFNEALALYKYKNKYLRQHITK